ncbi:hypothetical protein ACQPYK_25100 [Streptosporangium sp. CA-135522]|uniref:hypothetical protein n=1 Tax=Streptosporangium sp. CA-135522 TaxID=3240072 RepID=UPI003D8BD590
MDSYALFDPEPAADTAGTTQSWTTVTRRKVTFIIEDEFAAAPPIIRAGQRDFFPREAIYRWVWTPERGWDLERYELSGPNRKVDGSVGLMTVTERRLGFHPETWATLPDWLFLAMIATRPDWEPPAAQLQPAKGAVEALMGDAGDDEGEEDGCAGVVDGFGDVHSDAELEMGAGW